MSTLSSASTLTQIENAYLDNASYAEDRSTAKAKIFITACRMLIFKLPSAQAKGANSLAYNRNLLQSELDRAQAWLAAKDDDERPEPPVTRADFRRSR